MNKYFGMALITTSLLTAQASQASEMMSIDQLLAETDPVQKLEGLKTQNPENFKKLCEEIKDPSFYQKAEAASLGPIKRNRIINACEGVKFEQGAYKAPAKKSQEATAANYCSVASISKGPIVTEHQCTIISADPSPPNRCHIVIQNCRLNSELLFPKPYGFYTENSDRLENIKMERVTVGSQIGIMFK